jgi:PAS domain S-box-containing protein
MPTHELGAFDSLEDAGADELRARLHALTMLLARAPVPIAVAHDPECRFVSANPALARLLGVTPGTNVSMTPPPGETPPYKIRRDGQELPPEELPMQYAIRHRTSLRNEIEIERADGTVVYVQNDVEPLYDDTGAVTGCISVCVDLTERKQAADLLREVDRRKDQFLATLSHELRNPLAPIRNAVELLRMAPDDEAIRREALATMHRQLLQLVRLTDDLLDVSRINRDRVELRRERLDLGAIVQSAVESARPHVEAAGHWLTVRVPPEPVWLDGDFTRLAQAFSNVLINAVKYTERGGRIDVAVSIQDDTTASVTVTDTGIGIPPELLPQVFDMFTQLDHSLDRARGGLGIGLALTRRLVEMHGGSIEARSEGTGRGSSFSIRLPIVGQGTGGEAAAERPAAVEPGVAPRRILIAEDDRDAAEMLRMVLAYTGHDVRVANDGVEALALARESRPHVALIDIGMPRMDGYETARLIRQMQGGEIVLVALTGWGQDEDKARALEAGFDHHVTKPADPDVLQRLIAEVVRDE